MRTRAVAIVLVLVVFLLVFWSAVQIRPSGKPKNTAPIAEFWVKGKLMVNQPILFDAQPARDDKGIDSFKWALGDTFTAEGETVTHTYTSPGEYNVVLTVTDAEGCEGSTNQKIRISAEVNFTKLTAHYEETGYIVKSRYAYVNTTVTNYGGPQLSGAIRVFVEMVDSMGTVMASGEQSNSDTVAEGEKVLFEYKLDCGTDWASMSFRATLFLNNTQVELRQFGWTR